MATDNDGSVVIDIVVNENGSREKLKSVEHSAEDIGKSFEGASDKVTMFGEMLKASIASDLIMQGLNRLKNLVTDFAKGSISAGIEFESAFAGVKKTVEAPAAEIEKLRAGIRSLALEIPASTTELSAVAEAAGQLGIHTENILSFTETMIGLGEATNITSEQAAQSLAQFANITGMLQTDFDRLGSVIVALGNNFATTESDIVSMASRLAGVGTQVGMSEANIMALSTALSSLGIEAEAGGSAVSTALSKMQLAIVRGGEDLEGYAKIAGMSAQDFKKAFETDALNAFNTFIQGLNKAGAEGESMIAILDSMEISEIRQRDAILRLAGSKDILTDAITLANEAWEENTALQAEVNQRYETTESQIQIAKNALNETAITLSESLLPSIVEVTQSFRDFAVGNQDSIKGLGEVIGGLFTFITDNAGLIAGGLGVIGTAFVVIKTEAALASIAAKGFMASLGPVALAITGIVAVIGGVNSAMKEAARHTAEYEKSLLNASETLSELMDKAQSAKDNLTAGKEAINSYKELTEELKGTSLSIEDKTSKQEQLLQVEQQLITLSDGLISKADLERGAIENLLPVMAEQLELKSRIAEMERENFLASTSVEVMEAQLVKYKELHEKQRAEAEQFTQDMKTLMEIQNGDLENLSKEGSEIVWKYIIKNKDNAQLLSNFLKKDASEREAYINEAMKSVNDNLNETSGNILELTASIAKYNNLIKGSTDEQLQAFKSITEGTKAVLKVTQENTKALSANEEAAKAMQKEHGSAKKSAEDFTSAFEKLTTGAALSEKEWETILDQLPKISEKIRENGAASVTTADIILAANEDIVFSSKKKKEAAIADAKANLQAAQEEATRIAEAYEEERKAILKIVEVRGAAARAPWWGGLGEKGQELKELSAEAKRAQEDAEKWQAAYDKINSISISSAAGGSGGGKSKAKEKNEALDTELAKLEELKSLRDVSTKEEIAFLEDVLKNIKMNAEERRKIDLDLNSLKKKSLEEDKKIFEQQKDALAQALIAEGELRYENELYNLNKTVETFNKGVEDRKVIEEKALKESLENNETFLKLKEHAVTDSQKAEIKSLEDYFKDTAVLLSNDQHNKLKIYEDTTREWLREYDYLTDEQLDITKEKKAEEITYLQSKNNEYIKEIQELNEELALALLPLLDRENEITKAQKERSEAKKQQQREERLEAAQKAIRDAKDYEAREAAEKRLKDLEADYAEEDLRKQEQEELNKIKEEKQKLVEEHNKKIADLQEKIAINTGKIADFMDKILDNYTEIGSDVSDKSLEQTKKDAEKVAVGIMTSGEKGVETALKFLEKFNPDWQEQGRDYMDFLNIGLHEGDEELIAGMTTTSIDAMQGFINGMREKEPEIIREAERISNLVAEAMRGPKGLDEHSPSKVTYKIGEFAGEGVIYGTVDKIKKLMPSIQKAARSIPNALQSAGANIGSNSVMSQIYNNSKTVINNYKNNMPTNINGISIRDTKDIRVLAEQLGFVQAQNIMAVGGGK